MENRTLHANQTRAKKKETNLVNLQDVHQSLYAKKNPEIAKNLSPDLRRKKSSAKPSLANN